LDTYLRLLHPVMPFVTEQLWGALPHVADDPELLIVAAWPAAGERDTAAEAEIGAFVELVRAIRNARAEARVEAATWLPVRLGVPPELRGAVAGLGPAVERLARARPLEVVEDRAALGAATGESLAVVAGGLEALVVLGGRPRRRPRPTGPVSRRSSRRPRATWPRLERGSRTRRSRPRPRRRSSMAPAPVKPSSWTRSSG
jgi:valyl-tRNA synthetase